MRTLPPLERSVAGLILQHLPALLVEQTCQLLVSSTNETSGHTAACPRYAVSSDLTRLWFGGVGGFPCQVRIPRLARAVRTRAHSPARPELSPSATLMSDRAGAGVA